MNSSENANSEVSQASTSNLDESKMSGFYSKNTDNRKASRWLQTLELKNSEESDISVDDPDFMPISVDDINSEEFVKRVVKKMKKIRSKTGENNKRFREGVSQCLSDECSTDSSSDKKKKS